MADSIPTRSSSTYNWEEIERAESFLVSCMFEEASSFASTIIKKLNEDYGETKIVENINDYELIDMYGAAGMVFVQSMKGLGRTLEILKELKMLFGFVTWIPAQVLLTGVCFQISEGLSSDMQEYLEDFLSGWRYVEGEHYYVTNREWQGKQLSLGVDQYLEVVDLYVVRFLGIFGGDMDLGITWTEKAALPEEKRQELLRRLHSMNAPKATCSPHVCLSSSLMDKQGLNSDCPQEEKMYNRSSNGPGSRYSDDRENHLKETILKLSRSQVPFWWFRTITLKLGKIRLVISNGKIILGFLLLLTCYFLRRKQAAVKRNLRNQALSLKNALVDLWQLAFSYQVNPLAAVQPLPTSAQGSQ